MARLTEQNALKLIETLTTLSGALSSVHPEWEFERQQRIALAQGRLDALKKKLPTSTGGSNARSWQDVTDDELDVISAELRALRLVLLGLLDGDGPTEPEHHPMRFAFASPFAIYALFFVGFAGSGMTLREIVNSWPDATGESAAPSAGVEAGPESEGASVLPSAAASASPAPTAGRPDPSAAAASRPSGAGGIGAQASAPSASPSASAATSASVAPVVGAGGMRAAAGASPGGTGGASAGAKAVPPPAPEPSAGPAPSGNDLELRAAAQEMKEAAQAIKGVKRSAIKERDVLRMVILMGLLGGLLRLTSSMAKYVGNRALLRSWIIYYLLMPVVAASLAPMVYLLLRVGVLSAGASGTDNATAHLNVFGLYAFAALTGLFAEQAMGMLKDIFTRMFGGVEGKDSLHKGSTK